MSRGIWLSTAVASVLVACGGGSGGGGSGITANTEVGRYINTLPKWSEVSPRAVESDKASGETESEEVIEDTVVINEEGLSSVSEDVVYECNTTPFTLSSNPEKLTLFAPDKEVLYPGALVQGKSYINGLGGFLPLSIAERQPVSISIADLAPGDLFDNFRTVPADPERVNAAIGEMVGLADQNNLQVPSTTTFELDEFQSEKEFALKLGISGRHLNFSGSVDTSYDKKASESGLSVLYIERMFNVTYSAPNLPEQFFSNELTQARLDRYTGTGVIGPDNLPVYVSSVVYGRMLMFTITSSASSQELRATIQAAYKNIGSSVEAELSVKQKAILSESSIRLASVGGDSRNVTDVIKSGNWSAYFDNKPSLSTAAPLTYTLRNLGDLSVATVAESTEYNQRVCAARGSTGDTFQFRKVQELTLPVPAPATAHKGDFNGDGQQDLAWTHLNPGVNKTAIALSNGDGTFDFKTAVDHSVTNPQDSWGVYEAHVGDFNNDTFDDFAYVNNDFYNIVYLAYSNGDGTFSYSPEYRHVQTRGWGGYNVLIGNFDGVHGDDIAFSNTSSAANVLHLRVTQADGSLSGNTRLQRYGSGGGWENYVPFVANVDNDGDDDVIWNVLTPFQNATHVARFVSANNGSMFQEALSQRATQGWDNYQTLVGNIDATPGADMVFVNGSGSTIFVHKNRSQGNGSFDTSATFDSVARPDGFTGRLDAHLVDVNGDGKKDVVLERRDSLLKLSVALGTDGGVFDDNTRSPQTAPDQDDWSGFQLLTMDVDMDNDEDLVFINNAAQLRMYVALSR